jgi:acyl-CoA synthetase (AMP-forming)/AMP-acid ligase II
VRLEKYVGESAVQRRLDGWTSPKDMVAAAARRYANRTALVFHDRSWTFREVDERANRLAHALLGLGVRPDDRVSVLRNNIPEHVEIQLALLKVGAAMINVNPRLSPVEMAYQVTDSESRVLIVAEQFLGELEEMAPEIVDVETVLVLGPRAGAWRRYEDVLAEGAPTEPDVLVTADNLGYIRYTSGTTGNPKGVVHDQYTLAAVTRNLMLDYTPDLGPDDRMLALQGIYHGAGWFVLPCWLRGAALVIADDYDPGHVERLVVDERITMIKSVPTVLLPVIHEDGVSVEAMKAVRTIVYGASAIPRAALERGIDRLGQRFVQLYGQAESPMTITVLGKEDHTRDRLGSAGRSITFGRVRVVGDDGNVAVGGTGEIQVLGDHNMRGYWRGSSAPAEYPWDDPWVRTGDIGRMDEGGFVFLTDRKGEMIITGGLNVYPNEVEQVLYRHPAVREAAVVGVPDERWGERVVAIVVADPELRAAGTDPLDQLCRAELGTFKCPKEYRFVDDLPKNAAGKIMRRSIKESLWAGHERMVN